MDNSDNKRIFNIFGRSVEKLLVVALVITILAGIVIFLFAQRGGVPSENNSGGENRDDSQLIDFSVYGQPIPFDNPKEIRSGENSVSLNSQWNLTSVLKDMSKSEEFYCVDANQVDCIVYYVTDGNLTYYLSSPTELRSKSTIPTNQEERIIPVSGREVSFIYERVEVVVRNEGDESGSVAENVFIYKEIHGCVYNNLCVSSGLLNIDSESTNKSQVQSFESFVRSLIL